VLRITMWHHNLFSIQKNPMSLLLTLAPELLDISCSFLPAPERWWLRRVCRCLNNINSAKVYDCCITDYVIHRSEKTPLLSAVFVHRIVPLKQLKYSLPYATVPFFVWLLSSKLVEVTQKVLDICTRRQFAEVLKLKSPRTLKYYPTQDNPVKLNLYLEFLQGEGCSSFYRRRKTTGMWLHILTNYLPQCQDVLQNRLPFESNFYWRRPHLHEDVLIGILSTRLSQQKKKFLLNFKPLVFRPTRVILLIIAIFGSQWIDFVRFSTPVTYDMVKECYKLSFGWFRLVPRKLKRFESVHRNLNIFNVARRCGCSFPRLKQEIDILKSQNNPRNRARHTVICNTRLKTGFRKGDFCMRMRCRAHA